MKPVYEEIIIKEFRTTSNLNGVNTKIIMTNLTQHIEMWTKVIYSFKSEIYRSASEIVDYSKTLTSPPGMVNKAYLPTTRTTEAQGNYQGKLVFN